MSAEGGHLQKVSVSLACKDVKSDTGCKCGEGDGGGGYCT